MQRLLIVYNPRSSRFAEVSKDVIERSRELTGYIIGKYEVAPTNLEDNINKLSKILKDDDLVLSAGGDATGIIAVNAILKSNKDVRLAVLPYGNFNDLSRTLRTNTFDDVFLSKTHKKGVSLMCHSQSEGPELTCAKKNSFVMLTPSTYICVDGMSHAGT